MPAPLPVSYFHSRLFGGLWQSEPTLLFSGFVFLVFLLCCGSEDAAQPCSISTQKTSQCGAEQTHGVRCSALSVN